MSFYGLLKISLLDPTINEDGDLQDEIENRFLVTKRALSFYDILSALADPFVGYGEILLPIVLPSISLLG